MSRTHCKRGHDLTVVGVNAEGRCSECRREAQRKRAAADPEQRRAYQRHYREANRKKRLEYERRYRAANPEKVAEGQRRWREAHPDFRNRETAAAPGDRVPGDYTLPTTSRICQGCGETFPGKGRAKWCSDRCCKSKYDGVCVDCGARTNGSDGPGKAGERCAVCSNEYLHETRRWTLEAIVDAIHEWVQTHGKVPTSTEWHLSDGVAHPGTTTVVSAFGRWSDAIRAAGYEAVGPRRRPMSRTTRSSRSTGPG